MKKLFLISIMLLFSVISMAQVEIFEGSLDEAFVKAKAENKKVIIMGSGAK